MKTRLSLTLAGLSPQIPSPLRLPITHKSRLLPLPSFREGGWGVRTHATPPPPLPLPPGARPARRRGHGGYAQALPPIPLSALNARLGAKEESTAQAPLVLSPPRPPFPQGKGGVIQGFIEDVGNGKPRRGERGPERLSFRTGPCIQEELP